MAVLPIGRVEDREKLLSVCSSNGSEYLPDNVECLKIVFICFVSKRQRKRAVDLFDCLEVTRDNRSLSIVVVDMATFRRGLLVLLLVRAH